MKFLQRFSTWAGIFGLALILTSCAFTKTTTETVQNTSDASVEFTSSTSPRSDRRESSRARAVAFADANFDRLRAEMAVGNGEHLASLGFLLGVAEKHQQEFFVLTKNRFPSLFDSEQTTPEQLVARLDLELADNSRLRK